MQEASGLNTSPFSHSDQRKMDLRARKVSGAFEKRAPARIVRTIENMNINESKLNTFVNHNIYSRIMQE